MALFANSVQVCLHYYPCDRIECVIWQNKLTMFTLKGKIYSGSVCLAGQTYQGSV